MIFSTKIRGFITDLKIISKCPAARCIIGANVFALFRNYEAKKFNCSHFPEFITDYPNYKMIVKTIVDTFEFEQFSSAMLR